MPPSVHTPRPVFSPALPTAKLTAPPVYRPAPAQVLAKNAPGPSAPPAFRPGTAAQAPGTAPRISAPQVYRPGIVQRLAKAMPLPAPPPVYRPHLNPLLAKPANQPTAPPVYLPAHSVIRPNAIPAAGRSTLLQAKPAPGQGSGSLTHFPPMSGPQSAPAQPGPASQTIQRVKFGKLAKNIASLGLRKVYVNSKRKRRNAAAAAPPQVAPPVLAPAPARLRTRTPLTPAKDRYPASGQFTDDQLYEHLEAYEQARFFHATKDTNTDGILRDGILRSHGGSDKGASAAVGIKDRSGDQGRLFVGGDRKTALYYEQRLRGDKSATPETLRTFMTREQAESLANDFADSNNEAFYTYDHDIPGHAIVRGKFRDNTDGDITPAFDIVRQWYPGPGDVTTQEVIDRHREAISRGLTVHHLRPGSKGRGRFVRDVRNPNQGSSYGTEYEDNGYESD